MNDEELTNPDAFSAELHFALMTEGLRGPLLRKLMRLARNDVELSRVFETKVSEYRRFLRASRKPRLVNLPQRAWERFTDNVRFTPPREVMLTLLYVGVAMVGIELFKRHLNGPTPSVAPPMTFASLTGLTPQRLVASPPRLGPTELAGIEKWMIAELERASQSDAWRDAVARQIEASVQSAKLESLVVARLEEVIHSPEFGKRISDAMNAEINDRLAAHAKLPLENEPLKTFTNAALDSSTTPDAVETPAPGEALPTSAEADAPALETAASISASVDVPGTDLAVTSTSAAIAGVATLPGASTATPRPNRGVAQAEGSASTLPAPRRAPQGDAAQAHVGNSRAGREAGAQTPKGAVRK